MSLTLAEAQAEVARRREEYEGTCLGTLPWTTLHPEWAASISGDPQQEAVEHAAAALAEAERELARLRGQS